MKEHDAVAKRGFQDSEAKIATPMSEVVALEFHEAIELLKKDAAPVEVDIRDAKRRISAMKAPQKKEVAIEKDESSSDEAEA